MTDIPVNLGPRSYHILVGTGALGTVGTELAKLRVGRKAVLVTDPVIEKLHGEIAWRSLIAAGFDVVRLSVPEGEQAKRLETDLRQAQKHLSISVGNLREALEHNVESLRNVLPGVSLPGARHRLQSAGRRWYRVVLEKAGALSVHGMSTRRHLDRYWKQTLRSLRRGLPDGAELRDGRLRVPRRPDPVRRRVRRRA